MIGGTLQNLPWTLFVEKHSHHSTRRPVDESHLNFSLKHRDSYLCCSFKTSCVFLVLDAKKRWQAHGLVMTDHGECVRNPAKKTKQKFVVVEYEVLPPNAPKCKALLKIKKPNIVHKQKLATFASNYQKRWNFCFTALNYGTWLFNSFDSPQGSSFYLKHRWNANLKFHTR